MGNEGLVALRDDLPDILGTQREVGQRAGRDDPDHRPGDEHRRDLIDDIGEQDGRRHGVEQTRTGRQQQAGDERGTI